MRKLVRWFLLLSVFWLGYLSLWNITSPGMDIKYVETVEHSQLAGPSFAYVQYATDFDYLCSALINFENLRGFGSTSDFVLIYDSSMLYRPKTSYDEQPSPHGKLLWKAEHEQLVNLRKVNAITLKSESSTWSSGFTKFYAFREIVYTRVVYLDSDSTVLGNLDDLFFLPPALVAAPISYQNVEVAGLQFSTHIMVIRPSEKVFRALYKECRSWSRKKDDYDMEIFNKVFDITKIRQQKGPLFPDSLLILPHRVYGLLTGTLREMSSLPLLYADPEDIIHDRVSKQVTMDFTSIFNDAQLIHFSDYPVRPKPWYFSNTPLGNECEASLDRYNQSAVCTELLESWTHLYTQYAKQRDQICSVGLV